jgi:hemoglobin-like flavoprotein
MTPIQVGLVQESWQRVAPIKDEAAQLFYNRLFELDPNLRALFKGDLAEQRRKLMAMLGAAVSSLGRPDALLPILRELGRKHTGYGVQPRDYDTVGAALLWTLEQGLGTAFTAEVHDAWSVTYGLVASTMQSGAGTQSEIRVQRTPASVAIP